MCTLNLNICFIIYDEGINCLENILNKISYP